MWLVNMEIVIKEDVLKALQTKKGIVALESTIISHGLPYPENIKMAEKVEEIIRNLGATPATIAIIDGVIKVGLEKEDLEKLAKDNNVLKVSKRDFGYCLSKKLTGATTVSGTMVIANHVGIKVFATGGIGGVHRGARDTFDISRDLEELGDLNVLVVCAGAKSILDLGLTLEYLETKGVEVIGYQTNKLPAFYVNTSKYDVTHRLDTEVEVAKLMKSKWDLIKGGIVLANPIPKEFSLNKEEINKAIEDALIEAKERNILGKETTPFLLAKLKEITKGKSLEANLQLVYNNARLAALVANEYAKIKER